MSVAFPIDPDRTAVLSMDCQAAIVSIYTRTDKDDFLARAARVLTCARLRGISVIHIKLGFRPGLPEVSSHNRLFGPIKASSQHQSLFQPPLGDIHPALAPVADEVVITKHRVSAFAGTDLAMILKASNIDTLVLFGIATSGVVLSTLLEAGDTDFRLAVIEDCCADLDQDLHNALLARLFPQRAAVLSSAEFIEAA